MKVGIDVFGCNHAKSGLGSYILSFISNLPENCPFEIELFGSEEDRYTYTSNNGLPFVSIQLSDDLFAQRIWHRTKYKKFVKKQKYDVVIFPACEYVLPNKFNTKSVVVVNSQITSILNNSERDIYKKQLKKGLIRCSKIIAASEFIKQDLVKAGISSKKISIIHNGLDHKVFFPLVNLDENIIQISPFAIKRPYFIYTTRLSDENKMHIQLIKAFEEYKKSTGLPHRLVIAGDFTNPNYSQKVQNTAYNSEYSSDIFLIGYFPHENLPKLYGGADICIFPSVKEGVGLSILEAMACGIPVICSHEGALKEIGGDAPKYFDSTESKEIADLMIDIIENPRLKEKMIDKGLKRAAGYDWSTTVNKTFEIIKNL